MRLILIIIILLGSIHFSYCQKASLLFNYEPSLRIVENHVDDELYVIHGAVNRVGFLVYNKFAFGVSYHYLQTWLNFENEMIEDLDDSSGIGLFARYIFPWQVKDNNVKFYLESNLHYNDYQTFGGFFTSERKEFGLATATFGFEVNFFKYFYLNIGLRGNYFFTGQFVPRMRGLVEPALCNRKSITT